MGAAPSPPADMAAMLERLAPVTEAERLEHAPAPCPAKEGESGLDFDTVKQALEHGQEGDAALFVAMYQGRFCFDKSAGRWFTFGPHSWREDILDDALSAVSDVADIYHNAAPQALDRRGQAEKSGDKDGAAKAQKLMNALFKRAFYLRAAQYRKQVLELSAAGADSLAVTGQEWDSDPWLLGCANGIIDLRTGAFRAGKPEDYILKCSPVEWLGIDTPCPRWECFLLEIFDGDTELVSYLQRACGYCQTGSVKEQVMFILHGRGRNGKTVLTETLLSILGGLAIPISAEALLLQDRTRSAAAASPDITKLRGRRLVVASESGQGRKLDLGRVKHWTGDDTLTGRDLYARHDTVFKPTQKLFLLTNDKPRIDADAFALWERLHLIPFSLQFRTIPTAENERLKDPDLKDKLAAELPGILAWAVRGALIWQEKGLDPPEAVRLATSEYREGEDYFSDFLKEHTEPGPGLMVKASDLYARYQTWSKNTGYGCMNLTNFGRKVADRYPKIQNYKGVFYVGLALKPEHPE